MAFSLTLANAVPTVWANTLLENRDKQVVGVNLCSRDYEGEIKGLGSRVVINGVIRPTISDYTGASLSSPEKLPTVSTYMDITQAKYFNFQVDDIDERMAQGDFFDKELKEAATGFAEEEDSYVYSLIASGAGTIIDISSLVATTLPSKISAGMKALWGAHVPATEEISIEASPAFCEKVLLSRVLHGTDNTATLSNGYVDSFKFFNAKLYMSNNIHSDSSNYEYIVMRTKNAVSFASKLGAVEPFRPESGFGDAVKGLDVYDAKVVRPNEVVILRVQAYGSETTV